MFKSTKKACHVAVLWYSTHNLLTGSELIIFLQKTCKMFKSCAVIKQVKVLDSDIRVKLLFWLDPFVIT